MSDATPQLKRKRESAIGAQKKSKKQRKSEANAGQESAPAPELTAETEAAQQAVGSSKYRSRKPQTNGAPVDTPAITTPNSKPDEQSQGRLNGVADEADASDESADASAKQSKKQRKQEKKSKKNVAQLNGVSELVREDEPQETPDQDKTQEPDADKAASKKSHKEAKDAAKALVKRSSSPTKSKKHKNKTAGTWHVSPPQGGWFLPADPVFSVDEKYIILADPKSVHVYFAETSLLARILPLGSTASFITAYALSSTKPNQLYVADSSELITLWDWVEGTKIGRWQIGATVRNMVVITKPGSDEDLVYCHESGKHHVVNVHALRTKSQASQTELKQVLKTDSKILDIQVMLQGKYVIISTATSITVGKRLKASRTAVQDFEYIWRELNFSKRITSCDTYHRPPVVSEKGKKTAQGEREILDLAVGDEIGVVLLFEDILASFAALESLEKKKGETDSAESFRPKRLHWHRDAVGSVKWSLDGTHSTVQIMISNTDTL
jgi:NET1-associated nuclear protein 1 (U3 small nucleolar RNA-associated protein 17)